VYQKLKAFLRGNPLDTDKKLVSLHNSRLDEALNKATELGSCVFFYEGQFEFLIKPLKKHKIDRYGVINGNVESSKRKEIIDKFQAGEIDYIFLHPASTAHGVTLTRTAYTIWLSPPDSTDQFIQGNGRTRRQGQTKNTIVFMYYVQGTIEARIAKKLKDGKEITDMANELLSEI
jgi:SNF2 family DNA or RNA helicase